MKILGIDPGINECAWAIIDTDKGIQNAGLVPNPYDEIYKGEKVKQLLKEQCMADQLKLILRYLPEVDVAFVESTIGFHKGHQNITTLTRMGISSGVGAGAARCQEIRLITATQWKDVADKAANHERMLSNLSKRELNKITKLLEMVPNGKQHNVLDAIGIALWGSKQY